ncbi:hypothetical protein GCM10023306_11850 [Novosphingobium ginsenosidimutans]
MRPRHHRQNPALDLAQRADIAGAKVLAGHASFVTLAREGRQSGNAGRKGKGKNGADHGSAPNLPGLNGQ